MPAEDIIITAKWEYGDIKKPYKLSQLGLYKIKKENEISPALIISPGASLTVDRLINAHQAEGDAIVLKSEAPYDIPGSLIQQNAEGEATAERFIGRHDGDAPENQWHMVASPVENMYIRPEFVPEGQIPQWIDFYKWDESHTVTVNNEEVSGWWINSKDPGGLWNNDFEDTFHTGIGYLLAYGEPQEKTHGDRVHRFSGSLHTEGIAISHLTHTPDSEYAGWHLLGNPFASAIDWTQGDWQREHILGGPQIWDAQWSSYTPVINIIPAMTAFMVNTSGDGSLMIPAEARMHQATATPEGQADDPHLHKKKSLPEAVTSNTPPHVRIRARDIQGYTAQTSIILFREDATEGLDPLLDTPFMASHAPQLWSTPPAPHPGNDETPKLALNNLPEPYKNLNVPIGFVKNEGQQFHIELLRNTTHRTLFLEDDLQQQMHPLCMEKPYLFTAADQDPPGRFRLHFTDGTPPIPSREEDQHPRPRIHASRDALYVHTFCSTCSLSIFNIRGMLFMQAQPDHAGEHQFIHNLTPGIYIARFHCQKGSGTEKVFVP